MMSDRSATLLLSALCSLLYFTSYLSRYTLSVSISEIDSLGLLKKENLGVATMLLFISYGAGQVLSGLLGDKFKPQHVVCIGLFGAALSNSLIPFVITIPAAVAAVWFFHGLCQAMFWPPIVKILATRLPSGSYGSSSLAVSIAAHVANVSLYLLASLCIGTFGNWKILFYIALTACIAMFIIWIFGYSFFVRHYKKPEFEEISAKGKNREEKQSNKRLISAVLGSGALILIIGIILQGALKEGVTAWLPSYINEVYGASTSDSILKSVSIPIASIICLYVVGLIYRRWLHNEAVGAAIMFGIGTLMSLLIVLVPTLPPMAMIICAAILTASMHGVNLFLIAYLPARFAKYGKTSTVSGVTNACAYIGCAAYTYGLALIAQNIGWGATALSWLLISGGGFIACLAAIPLWKRFVSGRSKVDKMK